MSIGVRLKQLRIRKRHSLQQVADAVSSKAYIWELETGKSTNPSLMLLTRLAEHFGVGVAYLAGEDVDADEGRIGNLFRQAQEELDETDRAILEDMVQSLIRRRRKQGDAA